MTVKEWKAAIESKIRTLANHFVRRPLNYFTEPDIHSYLYLAFYRDKVFSAPVPTKDLREKTILIHREYPTFFRCDKKIPLVPSDKARSRGHYDFVVLDPGFVKSFPFSVVANKDYHLLPERFDRKPLIAAIEFKYIVREISRNMLREIEMDFQKLQCSIPYSHTAYALIFNRFGPIGERLEEIHRMRRENPGVKTVYAEAWYEAGRKKTYQNFWG